MARGDNEKDGISSLFVLVGLFLGLGVGFLSGGFIGWGCIGLELGFLAMTISKIKRRK